MSWFSGIFGGGTNNCDDLKIELDGYLKSFGHGPGTPELNAKIADVKARMAKEGCQVGGRRRYRKSKSRKGKSRKGKSRKHRKSHRKTTHRHTKRCGHRKN